MTRFVPISGKVTEGDLAIAVRANRAKLDALCAALLAELEGHEWTWAEGRWLWGEGKWFWGRPDG